MTPRRQGSKRRRASNEDPAEKKAALAETQKYLAGAPPAPPRADAAPPAADGARARVCGGWGEGCRLVPGVGDGGGGAAGV